MSSAQAYIPSSRMILDRVAENALKMPLYVEQDLTITSGDQTVSVKEQWLFEDEHSIRLLVHGAKDLKDQLIFQNLYADSQKTTSLSGLLQTQKMARPLLEKVFFFKSSETLMKNLVQQGVVGEEIFRSQIFKKGSGPNAKFQYIPEPFLRLGRIGGGIAYVLGVPPKGDSLSPGLWVEQDQFNILKLRVSTGEELRAEKPTAFSKGARWPKELSYSWPGQRTGGQAQAQVLVVRKADANQRQIFQKNSGDKRTSVFERNTGRYLIEEFYQKFR